MEHFLEFSTNLFYDPITLQINQSLKLINKSPLDDIVFKIKTNQKNLVSMTINHGFIKPGEIINIQVKIVEKVDQGVNIKLQVNWAKATPQIKAKNDSKMATISKQAIFKNSFTIQRKVQIGVDAERAKKPHQFKYSQILPNPTSSFKIQEKKNLYSSLGSQRKSQSVNIHDESTRVFLEDIKSIPDSDKQQLISSETKIASSGNIKSNNYVISPEKKRKLVSQSPASLLLTEKIMLDLDHEQQLYPEQNTQIQNQRGQHSHPSQTVNIHVQPQSHNLQVVAEQDEQDSEKYEKEIQMIKNEQINQMRLTDEIKTKVSRLRAQIKGKEFISFEQLLIILCVVFVLGGVIGDFMF